MCSKDNFLQEVRALCIFTVILLHVPFQGHDNISFNTWLMSKQLITFPVAVFFFYLDIFILLEIIRVELLNCFVLFILEYECTSN